MIRTRTGHLSAFTLDDGASLASFRRDSGAASASIIAFNRLPPSTIPPSPTFPSPSNSSLAPPLHYHIYQHETFTILSGRAIVYTFDSPVYPSWRRLLFPSSSEDCRARLVSAGEKLLVPAGIVHAFRNASADEPLELEFHLEPASVADVEQTFFRNTWSYREDCRKAGLQRSLLQVLCFNVPAGVVLMLPGCGMWTSRVLGALGAWVGRWVWGLRSAYEEYGIL